MFINMIDTREQVIAHFSEIFGTSVNEEPTVELLELQRKLIEEEINELFSDIESAISYIKKGETVPKELYANMLKELADVQIVISGMSVSFKPLQKLDEAFYLVHESNMSKLDNNGKPILREDGKILKGPNYVKPDLSNLIQ